MTMTVAQIVEIIRGMRASVPVRVHLPTGEYLDLVGYLKGDKYLILETVLPEDEQS